MKRDILTSPRLIEIKKRKRKVLLNKLIFFSISFFIILIILSFVSRLARLNINEIEVTGNKIIETEQIKTEVSDVISKKYLWFFPKTNVFFYPKENLNNVLSEKFKRLKDINFSIENNRTLAISLDERKAMYTWCGVAIVETNDIKEKCYFLDKEGYIFDEAPYFSGNVYFRFYGNLNGNIDEPLGLYFSKENFSKFVSFKETLESMNLKPVALSTANDGLAKIYLSRGSSLSNSPEIIFKINTDLGKTIENLQTVFSTEPLQTDFKNKYSSLLYIDLRFGNKVYYKFK